MNNKAYDEGYDAYWDGVDVSDIACLTRFHTPQYNCC